MLIGHKHNKIIELDNVSNIAIVRAGKSDKVIFNMNHSVKIFNDKYTADYVYWEFYSNEELSQIKKLIIDKIPNWILPIENGQRYINPKCVSSISIDDYRNRVIFNLNYNVTHPKEIDKLTSDFVFQDFQDVDNFNKFVKKLESSVSFTKV